MPDDDRRGGGPSWRRRQRWGPWAPGEPDAQPDDGWPGPWGGRQRWSSSRRGHWLFLRFLLTFGVMVVALIVIPTFVIAWSLGRANSAHTWPAVLLGRGGIVLAVVLVQLAVRAGRRASRRITRPLGDLMAAADAVAAGDLSARVPDGEGGEFGRLAASFNHMAGELQRADQQRRNLTADVAHELRTPLHIIQGNLEGVLDGVYVPSAEHIQATLAETRSLARLVDDLRTLSLAEAGQLPLAHERVDVAELLADVATSFSGQAEAAGLALEVETDAAGGAAVTGDEGRLDQVLGNLVINAVRHTPPGGRVTLAATAGTRDGPGLVRITVADPGEGIAAGDLPYVFDRFWRGDRARSRPAEGQGAQGTPGAQGAEGSGLGLAIARQLVQAHGGRIAVASVVGQGTTFTIELPAADSQQ